MIDMKFVFTLIYLCAVVLCNRPGFAQHESLQLSKVTEKAEKAPSQASQQYQKLTDYYQKPELMYPWDVLFEVPEKHYQAGRYKEASNRNQLIINSLATQREQVQLS